MNDNTIINHFVEIYPERWLCLDKESDLNCHILDINGNIIRFALPNEIMKAKKIYEENNDAPCRG